VESTEEKAGRPLDFFPSPDSTASPVKTETLDEAGKMLGKKIDEVGRGASRTFGAGSMQGFWGITWLEALCVSPAASGGSGCRQGGWPHHCGPNSTAPREQMPGQAGKLASALLEALSKLFPCSFASMVSTGHSHRFSIILNGRTERTSSTPWPALPPMWEAPSPFSGSFTDS